jgi:hypothetical protein
MRRLLMMTAAVLLVGGVSALADPSVVEGTYGTWTAFAAKNPMTDAPWYGAKVVKPETGDMIQVECEPPRNPGSPEAAHISAHQGLSR